MRENMERDRQRRKRERGEVVWFLCIYFVIHFQETQTHLVINQLMSETYAVNLYIIYCH